MKRLLSLILASAFTVSVVLPPVAVVAYDPSGTADVVDRAYELEQDITGGFTRYTSLQLGEFLEAAGLKGANAKLCVTEGILGQLGNIIRNFEDILKSELSGLLQELFSKVYQTLATCAIGAALKTAGGALQNIPGLGSIGGFLQNAAPQCVVPAASDVTAALLKQRAEAWKQNFIGRCVAAASVNDSLKAAADILATEGPNGGPAAVQSWINDLYTEPDRQAMRRMWAILVNTPICPYFREAALLYFGVPASYVELPPSIGTEDLNTSADAPFQLRAACTLPDDYIPGSESSPEQFMAQGGFALLSEISREQNNLPGFIGMAEAELNRQRAVTVQSAVNEAVSGGGFRSLYGSWPESCKTIDPDGNCIEPGAVKRPPGGVENVDQASLDLITQWMTSTDGTDQKAIADMAAQFKQHIENQLAGPLPFRIEFGFEDDTAFFTPVPTPTPSADDVACTGGDPRCQCVRDDPAIQGSIRPSIAAVMRGLQETRPDLFAPPGSSTVAPGVTNSQVIQALCDLMNSGGGTTCRPHPSQDDELVLVGEGLSTSVDVITADGNLRTNGGTAIAICERGVQD